MAKEKGRVRFVEKQAWTADKLEFGTRPKYKYESEIFDSFGKKVVFACIILSC
jgi:hypothetical protein